MLLTVSVAVLVLSIVVVYMINSDVANPQEEDEQLLDHLEPEVVNDE